MRRTLQRLPFLLILQGIGAAAMFVPAIHAYQLRYLHTARSFFYSGLFFLIIFVLLAVAMGVRGRDGTIRGQLTGLVGALLILPLMLAVPFREALVDARILNSWFEMISCLTTTGATLYPGADQLPPTLHLWRAMVGWMGGLLFWVSALAILAPLNLGGFEVIATDVTAAGRTALRERRAGRPGERLRRYAGRVAPIYATLTLVLWIGLVVTGLGATEGAIMAMSTMSTSGITPGPWTGLPVLSELLIFCFLFFAVSRLTFRNDFITRERGVLLRDPEMRLAITLLVLVPAFLFVRHFAGSIETEGQNDLPAAGAALWGSVFTTMSFLTTMGLESAAFESSRFWSGLQTPGLLLVGLSLIGGGVATTAGGVKLLRIYALYKHGAREMGRLVYPSSVGGSGMRGRRLRREGAFVAWIFFMLFALTIAATMAALSLAGLDFSAATILAVAALSNTGPLAAVGGEDPILYSELGTGARLILGAVMVIGRLEALAIIALFNSDFWRG
ncbi:TrkH family potassium uptake protein [Palleronia abyssalis]|mgnify:CR=1 FL=1|uniref:Trk system potassium uptake protein TrkH n=1 Tax=Palleronia abyssalis TaxID=1501240 RepID=A0A2R8BRN9_9RHOB|nr:potassium transporter TrkG [Palleronia abyssalis]SPJ22829.1 Trk system potassium uptake protein TrkH [Palleronia abyssalis]